MTNPTWRMEKVMVYYYILFIILSNTVTKLQAFKMHTEFVDTLDINET